MTGLGWEWGPESALPPTPGASPSCSALIALLALLMLLSGVLLWLNLQRRCMAAAQPGGDSPIPVCPHPSWQLLPQPPRNARGHGHGAQVSSCWIPVPAPCPFYLAARRRPGDQSSSATTFQPMGAIYLPTKAEAPDSVDTETTQLMKEDMAP